MSKTIAANIHLLLFFWIIWGVYGLWEQHEQKMVQITGEQEGLVNKIKILQKRIKPSRRV